MTDIIAEYSAQINAATDKATVEALTQAGVATIIEQIKALGIEGLNAVTYSISTYQEILGEMGTPCTDCPAVEVTKGGKKVILYILDKVKFIKK